jgi:hypothetical protein
VVYLGGGSWGDRRGGGGHDRGHADHGKH